MNNFNLVFLYLTSIALLIASCNTTRLDLDKRYKNIRSIITTANCQGPQGEYITKVESNLKGPTHFYQKYSYKNDPTNLRIYPNNTGFQLDPENQIVDSLSAKMIAFVKNHEFHKIHISPEYLFHDFQVESNFKNEIIQYSARDQFDNPATLIYHKSDQTISRIIMINFFNPDETIEINFDRYFISPTFGPLLIELSIIQGGKDEYVFVFSEIWVNNVKIPLPMLSQ